MEKRAQNIVRRYSQDEILAAAAMVMESKISYGDVFSSPNAVKDYLRFRLGAEEREHFMVLFLNSQNGLIESDKMFSGTVTQTSVYPREIVRKALKLNACAVILAHNHPSGTLQPSRADETLTQSLKSALSLVDVRVLDHIIVSPAGSYSFAETGLI